MNNKTGWRKNKEQKADVPKTHMFQQVRNQNLVCHVWVVLISQITFKLPSIHLYELHHHSSGTMSEVKTENKLMTVSNKMTIDTQVSKVQVGGV